MLPAWIDDGGLLLIISLYTMLHLSHYQPYLHELLPLPKTRGALLSSLWEIAFQQGLGDRHCCHCPSLTLSQGVSSSRAICIYIQLLLTLGKRKITVPRARQVCCRVQGKPFPWSHTALITTPCPGRQNYVIT